METAMLFNGVLYVCLMGSLVLAWGWLQRSDSLMRLGEGWRAIRRDSQPSCFNEVDSPCAFCEQEGRPLAPFPSF
jgi:hypothetical protein